MRLTLSVAAPSRQWITGQGHLDYDTWRKVRHALHDNQVVAYYQGACFANWFRFAGTDTERKDALLDACEIDADVMVALRGGYGAHRTLAQLTPYDWDRWAEAPLAMMGYSDFTAISTAYSVKTGRLVWQGPTMKDWVDVDALTRQAFVMASGHAPWRVDFTTTTSEHDGLKVTGQLWGGNLSVLVSMVGSPYWTRHMGDILFLEDQGESAWQIERMLWQLYLAGSFEQTKTVLIGNFKGIDRYCMHAADFGWSTVKAQLQAWGVRVIEGLPFGHIHAKTCLPVGATVDLAVQGSQVTLDGLRAS